MRMSVGYHPEGKGHHREPSRPKTIVFGVDAGDVDRRADTPSIGQPKLTTETLAHRNYR